MIDTPSRSLPRLRSGRLLAAASVAALLLATLAGAAEGPKKVIIDTDPGTDDAMAILLALNSPELEVLALTVVPGNVALPQAMVNARKLAALAKRCDIPVAAGADRPMVGKLTTAEFIHGENGLANVELAVAGCEADPRFGPDLIIELVRKHPGEIILLPVGPLTNIALAALKDPSIVPLVKEVVLMGGSLSGGNASAAAEANIHGDPEAAQIVFEAGWPVTMVGLDATEKTVFTSAYLGELSQTNGPQNDFAAAVLEAMIDRLGRYGREGMSMHDPLAVGAVIDPTLITTECYRVDVETRGELTRGETVADRRDWEKPERCAEVALGVDSDRFLRLFVSRLKEK